MRDLEGSAVGSVDAILELETAGAGQLLGCGYDALLRVVRPELWELFYGRKCYQKHCDVMFLSPM